MTHIGSLFQPSSSLLERCHINTAGRIIVVECDSIATDFQMIAQLSNSSEVHRLYASKTTDRQTSASVVVEENGLYRVIIFAIREGRGIVDSHVEFMDHITVNNVRVPITTAANAITTTAITTLGMLTWNYNPEVRSSLD